MLLETTQHEVPDAIFIASDSFKIAQHHMVI